MAARERKRRIGSVQVTAHVQRVEARRVPWLLAAPAGGVLVALAGWIIVAGATVVGWLAQPTSSFGSALKMGTQLWLLANGGAVEAGGLRLSVVPLGLTAVLVLLATGAAGYAVQQACSSDSSDDENLQGAWRASGLFTVSYVACVALGSLLTSAPLMGRALLGSGLVAGGSAAWMMVKHAGWRPFQGLPEWTRVVPRAMAAALLVLVVGGGIVVTAALLQHRGRVIELHSALNPGIAGGLLLLVVQLAWLPNLIAWCISWTLGAGFSIGQGSVIAPSETTIGLLPALPVFGAIPEPGPGSGAMLSWLLVGVIAGVAAAVSVVVSRPRARFDETALAGGLAGVLAGLAIVGLLALTNGGFGSGRLSEIGARVGHLAIMAPTLLGLSGVVAGLVLGLVRRPERPGQADDAANADTTDTAKIVNPVLPPTPTDPANEDTSPNLVSWAEEDTEKLAPESEAGQS